MPAHPNCANRLFPPPSPLPWAPAPGGQPAWKTHAEDHADPHGTRLLVPALRMGPGAPALLAGDKPTDLYYDLSAGALYVCVEIPGGREWRAASSQSYTKAEVDELVDAVSKDAEDAKSAANAARTAAETASSTADAAEQAAAAASAKADAKQDKLSFTSTPDDKDNKVVTQGYVDGVKTDAAAARTAADAAAADAKASATSAGTASADAAAAKASATSAETAAGQAQAAAATAADDVGTARAAASSAQSDAALAGDAAYRAEGAATAAKNAASDAQNAVSQHSGDMSNPHSVTASQIGAYTKTEVDDKLGAKQDNLSFTSSDGCSADNPVALKDYVDAAVEGSVSEESDPVFAKWLAGSSPSAGLGASATGAGSVAIGHGARTKTAKPSYADGVVLIGKYAMAAQESDQSGAVAIGRSVVTHGPDTFSIRAPSLDKIYLGPAAPLFTLNPLSPEASPLPDALGEDTAKTLKSILDASYFSSAGGAIVDPDQPADAPANAGAIVLKPGNPAADFGASLDLYGGYVSYSFDDDSYGKQTSWPSSASLRLHRPTYGDSVTRLRGASLVVEGTLVHETAMGTPDYGPEDVVVRGSDGYEETRADVTIAGLSVRGLFDRMAAVEQPPYRVVRAYSASTGEFEVQLADRKVFVATADRGRTKAWLNIPSFPSDSAASFDCVVWLVPNGASEDGPLELICADGDVHLADGSEAKVWKDGVTVVTVTGAKPSDNSTPVYLVSVKHFSKLAGDA